MMSGLEYSIFIDETLNDKTAIDILKNKIDKLEQSIIAYQRDADYLLNEHQTITKRISSQIDFLKKLNDAIAVLEAHRVAG